MAAEFSGTISGLLNTHL